MIVGAAVCPGAPFLVKGVADGLRLLHPEVRAACRQALSALPTADSLYILTGVGRSPRRATAATMSADRPFGQARWLGPGAVLRAGIERSDHPAVSPVELAPGGGPEVRDCATGTFVAAHLLHDAGITAPATAVEVAGDPDQAAAELADQVVSTARVALVVIADGAACHGDSAPGRRDDRAAAFDDRIIRALIDGDPTALAAACADVELSAALLAGVDPLLVLARCTAGRPPGEARVLYSGAPLGVGYFVGYWRWAAGEPA